MAYGAVADRLAGDPGERTVAAFPDGSVDVYYAIRDDRGRPVEERTILGDRIAESDAPIFPVERRSREPGGQAVNMALQAGALGDDVRLFGHLDDPVFDDLDVAAASMGEPSRIVVVPFPDEDVLFAEESDDVVGWTLPDARTIEGFDSALGADAVCCGNWASIDGMTAALSDLAATVDDGESFVFDPGPLSIGSAAEIETLFATLGNLDAAYDVAVSLNPSELDRAADVLDVDGDGRTERLGGVREAAGVRAVVLHATSEAIAATRSGTVAIPSLRVDDPTRHTGPGDRFGAGLAHALARDWGWEPAIALANCCAAYYVETATTGDRRELREYALNRR